MESAYDWGLRHESCPDALEMRMALGPDKTQADWWRECPRCDWLVWELRQLPELEFQRVYPALDRALEKIVLREVTNHALHCGVEAVEAWAQKWVSGEDRTAESAERATCSAFAESEALADSAACKACATCAARGESMACAAWAAEAARGAELKLQAEDIRSEIPEWPGSEV